MTVEHFLTAKQIDRFALYMQDYGVPVGFRVMTANPSAVTAVIVQNGVIHLDGFPAAQDPNGELRRHWRSRNPDVDRRRAQYAASLGFPSAANWEEDSDLSPDTVLLMNSSEQRPGVILSRNDLWADYGSNVAQYPEWQKLLTSLKVPVMVVWGSRDDDFTTSGAVAYLRDVPSAEVHILDTVHFATMEQPDEIAALLASFLQRRDNTAIANH